MIVITGAAGFIGSNMVAKLNAEGYMDLILVDDFSVETKFNNLLNKNLSEKIDRDYFFPWLDKNYNQVDFIFILGPAQILLNSTMKFSIN